MFVIFFTFCYMFSMLLIRVVVSESEWERVGASGSEWKRVGVSGASRSEWEQVGKRSEC
jgi:hypothetical protein